MGNGTMSEVTDPELLKQLNAGRTPEGPAEPQRSPGYVGPRLVGYPVGIGTDLAMGVGQGLLDPIEGLIQMAEKSTDWKLAPDSIRNWARSYRNDARSTLMGMGGEVLGNVLPGASGLAGRVVGLIPRIVSGAAMGAAQPVEGGGDYWKTKRNQASWGGITGGLLPPVAQGLGGLYSIPAPIARWLGIHHLPLQSIVQQASRLPAGSYGRVAGQVAGENPVGQPQPEPPRKTPLDALGETISGIHQTPTPLPGQSLYRGITDLAGWDQPPPKKPAPKPEPKKPPPKDETRFPQEDE
jgi:hypothetical protein